MSAAPESPDSHCRSGGAIPGTWEPDDSRQSPAYALYERQPSALPVLIAVPHAGRRYPESLEREMRHGGRAMLRLEDRHVDLIGRALARETGANLLVAHAPRAMLDLNRAPDDVDWQMLRLEDRPELGDMRPVSPRVRSGLGLVPRRLPGLGELWRRPLDARELRARIAGVHAPYHAALDAALADLRQRWGAALLIDLHSMPPLQSRGGVPGAEIVIGDRFGASCQGRLVAETFAYLGAVGRRAAHNRPYAGGYVLERHARPAAGIHAIQLEVDRSRYLDAALDAPGAGLGGMVEDLVGLVRLLAGAVCDLGRGAQGRDGQAWPVAAE
ncbi:N-formylglutamate amidohydrolase [Novosphingobium sp. YJ-S2-02]|uniref:N-formylglutamate amidohydrolase n=1 Tax=Novosphingobium aureum TaxID=2792964 RepID=A0A931HCE5_9SPHN|nr:N-formylglutamate amidohydrolase [Novosphingobium aureum]